MLCLQLLCTKSCPTFGMLLLRTWQTYPEKPGVLDPKAGVLDCLKAKPPEEAPNVLPAELAPKTLGLLAAPDTIIRP